MNENPTDGGNGLPGYSLNMSELPLPPEEPRPPAPPQPPDPTFGIPPAPRPPGVAPGAPYGPAPAAPYGPAQGGPDGPAPAAYPTAVPAKPKLNGGFFILGFFTPWIVDTVVTLPLGFAFQGLSGVLSVVWPIAFLGVPAAQLGGWLIGRGNGNNRLRSWGLGGLVAIVVEMLLALLLFGACMLTLGSMGS